MNLSLRQIVTIFILLYVAAVCVCSVEFVEGFDGGKRRIKYLSHREILL
jgi:hypothetical protein